MNNKFAQTSLVVVVDGATYEEVRWGHATDAGVSIFHKTGVATIPYEKLPPEIQSRYGYPEIVARRREQENNLYREQVARQEALTLQARTGQVTIKELAEVLKDKSME